MEQQDVTKTPGQQDVDDKYNQNVLANTQFLRKLRLDFNKNNDEIIRSLAGICSQLHIMQERLTRIESKCGGKIKSSQANPDTKQQQKIITNETLGHEEENENLSGSEGIHRLCLQEHVTILVNDIDLTNTVLLDELIEDDCITDNEATLITKNQDRRNQIRKLIYLISRRSRAKFVKFLEKLQRNHNYPYIAKELTESFQRKLSKGSQNSECLICVIKRDVDISHIAEKLCQSSIVDLEFLDMIASRDSSLLHDQDHLWEAVFAKINHSTDKRQSVRKLQEALSVKYEHIAAKLNLYFAKQITCHCGEGNTALSSLINNFPMSFAGSLGSLSDFSTTSDVKSQLRKMPYTGVLQSPTVSSTTDNTASFRQPENVLEYLPRTFQWLESIDNGGFVVTSPSDVDSKSIASSYNRDSFEQLDEGDDVSNLEKNMENGSVSESEKNNVEKGENKAQNIRPESLSLNGNTKRTHLESSSAVSKLTSNYSTSFHHDVCTENKNPFKYHTFDHHYSATQKFIDGDMNNFTFSKPDALDEPTTKKKRKIKRRTKKLKDFIPESMNKVNTSMASTSCDLNVVSLDDNANKLNISTNKQIKNIGSKENERDNVEKEIAGLTNNVTSITLT